MSKESIKKFTDQLPYPLGKILSLIPMDIRLAPHYLDFQKKIKLPATTSELENDLKKIILYSKRSIEFYAKKYSDITEEHIDRLSIEKINKIPLLTKPELQKLPLDERSAKNLALKKSNTGGTTGQPLDFYLEKTAYAREWAHMHAIWATLGYRYTDEKITIRGKNIGNRFFKYNFNQNEFLINAYAPHEDNLDACRQLITKRNIKWIHGYPSSTCSFVLVLESEVAGL